MSVTKVWAPLASSVELSVGSERIAMQRGDSGWWRAENYTWPADQDYQFRVNGELFPDPRSAWQPQGVHGPSRSVDHSRFAWTDEHWQARPLASAIIYELHVGTFTPQGTFDAAIERLDHLVELGITHVELMPVAAFLGNHGWGYDGVCPYAPHHAYGGPEALKRLVNACHAKGLAVLLDVVYNHLGPSGNYLPRFGPYFTDRHSTPWGAAINFDGPDSDEVRRYFIENALMWLRDYHFDGLRLDAIHAIVDSSAYPFLEELSTAVDELQSSLGRHLVLVAESDLNDPRVVRPRELGGFGLHAQWSDDIHHALHSALTGEREGYYADFGELSHLATAMTWPFVYAGKYSEHRKRRHGRPAVNVSANRFIAYFQNHDQLGNRAKGDRLCHLVGPERVKIGAALTLLSPFVPMLFQGEEWSASAPFQYFVDFGSEPELAEAVIRGRHEEFSSFGWQPDDIPSPNDPQTFRRSKLDWHELAQPEHREMFRWYRDLIRLRRRVSAFTTGCLDETATDFSEDDQWLRIERGPMTIACNFARQQRTVPLTDGRARHVLQASKPLESNEPRGLVLPPETVVVLGPEDF